MRIIGLDVGDRRVGIAVTDPTGTAALPLETVDASAAVERVKELAAELDAVRIVVGLPINMDGSEGEQAARTRDFAFSIADELALPVSFVDERLTTREAGGALAGARVKGTDKKGAADRIAASLILRQFLEMPTEE